MRRLVGLIFALIIVIFGLSFAVLNDEHVNVDYYLGVSSLPLSLALTVALVFGATLGLLAAIAVILRQRRELARLRRRVGDAEKELGELRKVPVRDAA